MDNTVPVTQGLDNMEIDPVDDGPKPSPSPPLMMSPVSNTLALAVANTAASAQTMTKEEEAKQAIDQLRGDDVSNRVASAHRLDAIASVLGPERTREVSSVSMNEVPNE